MSSRDYAGVASGMGGALVSALPTLTPLTLTSWQRGV